MGPSCSRTWTHETPPKPSANQNFVSTRVCPPPTPPPFLLRSTTPCAVPALSVIINSFRCCLFRSSKKKNYQGPRWMANTTSRPKRCFTSIPSCSLASSAAGFAFGFGFMLRDLDVLDGEIQLLSETIRQICFFSGSTL